MTGPVADPPAARRSPGRPPTQVTKKDVLATAARLFDERGYAQTTMQDIAASLKVAKPTLYSLAGNKVQLLEAIFDTIIEGADRILAEAEAAQDVSLALRLFIRESLMHGARNRAMMNVFLSHASHLPAASLSAHEAWSREAYHRLKRTIERSRADGGVDPMIVAFAITSFINQLPQWFSERGALSLEAVADNFAALIENGVLLADR